MNQGKLDVVKQEMARLNIGHLRNQMHLKNGQLCKNLIQRITISTTVGKNPLEEMTMKSTKESEMQYLETSSKTRE